MTSVGARSTRPLIKIVSKIVIHNGLFEKASLSGKLAFLF